MWKGEVEKQILDKQNINEAICEGHVQQAHSVI